jgi:hypothetical protein
MLLKFIKHTSNSSIVFGRRTEVPGLGNFAVAGQQMLAKEKITGKTLEHVLPRAGGVRDRISSEQPRSSARDIGDQSIFRPVPPPIITGPRVAIRGGFSKKTIYDSCRQPAQMPLTP